jgi:tetratricopeptide (TPR) repeat protein
MSEAIREIRIAEDISPLSHFVTTCVGIVQYYSGDFSNAIHQFDRALELQPHFHLAHWHRGWALAETGRFDDAIEALKTAVQASHSAAQTIAALGHVLAAAGRRKECHAVLQQLKEIGAHTYVSPYDLALIYIALDQQPKALRLLHQAVEQRVPALARLNLHPVFATLRKSPTYQQLLTKINLPDRPCPANDQPTRPARKRRPL